MVGSRFELVAAPALQPAEDAITRSTVGPFVDTGAWTIPGPQKRRIYLSVDTIRELAITAGIVAPEGAGEAQIAHAYATGALDTIKEALGGDLVRVLVRLAGHLDAWDAVSGLADGAAADGSGDSSDRSGLERYLSALHREREAS